MEKQDLPPETVVGSVTGTPLANTQGARVDDSMNRSDR